MRTTFRNPDTTLATLLGINPFIAHALLSDDLEHKRSCWSETTVIVDATTEAHDVNISEHPVYRYRLEGDEPSRTKYAEYLEELLNSRGMRERDLRNLCGKRLGVNPGDVHGEILKGRILWAMEKRERFLQNCTDAPDPELEVYEARDPNHTYRTITKERAVPRWWMPEKVESRAKLAGLTTVVTPLAVDRIEDRFGFVDVENSPVWQPKDRSGALPDQKRKYREQIWGLLEDGFKAELRNMAGKLLVCESKDSWYGEILRGAVIWSCNDYIEKFKKGIL